MAGSFAMPRLVVARIRASRKAIPSMPWCYAVLRQPVEVRPPSWATFVKRKKHCSALLYPRARSAGRCHVACGRPLVGERAVRYSMARAIRKHRPEMDHGNNVRAALCRSSAQRQNHRVHASPRCAWLVLRDSHFTQTFSDAQVFAGTGCREPLNVGMERLLSTRCKRCRTIGLLRR